MNNCGCGKSVGSPVKPELLSAGIRGYSVNSHDNFTDYKRGFETGTIDTAAGPVPVISTQLKLKDHLGAVNVRWGLGRMDYRVRPGLYAVGNPDADSPVIVSANYKLTFDSLRKELSSLNLWMIILDTQGVNVWCAAGKGTFGTDEVIRRVNESGIAKIVRHRTLILPQLGAPGVAAHVVTKMTSFRVVYGPVYARDLPAFIATGLVKTKRMTEVFFTVKERLAVVPMEIVGVAKYLPLIFLIGAVPAFIETTRAYDSIYEGLFVFSAVFAGAVVVPSALPLFGFVRPFSAKGFIAGALTAVAAALLLGSGVLKGMSWILMAGPIAAYLALNFTGATTFTCESGVRKEIRIAMPLLKVSFVAGAGLRIFAVLVERLRG
ncbi:MAG TPA: mercury methylation corrinoid protein HgcA [Spirochaetota bacterium]|nr:mercury methylation corrinoid protein HgcA [Spirochaetota bacterium]